MTLKTDANFEEKLTSSSKNVIRNLLNFNASREKSENFQFYALFLLKLHYV